MRLVLVLALLAPLLAGPLPMGAALAANPSERLTDPELEARARALSKELRCMVCQNQSIDDSDADVARDLRLLVRERISAGDSDDDVLTYLTDRYGAFVRLRPPFTASTIALWVAPALVVVFALVGGGLYIRSRRVAVGETAMLTEDEEKALQEVLEARKER